MQPKKWSKAQSNRVKPQPQTPLAEPLGPGWSHLAFCGQSSTLREKKITRMAPPWGQWNRPWQGKTSGSRCDVKMSSGPSEEKALDWVRTYNQTQMKRIAKLVGLVWHLTQTRRLNIPDLSGFRWISWQASKNYKWPAIREYWEYTIAIDRFKESKIPVSSTDACYLLARLGAWTWPKLILEKRTTTMNFSKLPTRDGHHGHLGPRIHIKQQSFNVSKLPCFVSPTWTRNSCSMCLGKNGDPFRSRSLQIKMKPLWRNLRGGDES